MIELALGLIIGLILGWPLVEGIASIPGLIRKMRRQVTYKISEHTDPNNNVIYIAWSDECNVMAFGASVSEANENIMKALNAVGE